MELVGNCNLVGFEKIEEVGVELLFVELKMFHKKLVLVKEKMGWIEFE